MNRIGVPKTGEEGIEKGHHNIFNALNKAEGICKEYADYFENGMGNHEFSEHPLPFNQRVVEVFADLHDAICFNIWLMDADDIDRITKVINEIRFMGIDESELNQQFDKIVTLLKTYRQRMIYQSTIMDLNLPN